MVQCRVHVQGVPEHHHVDHQAQRPVGLPGLRDTLADFAPLAMEDRPGHAVPAFSPVQLREDAPAVVLVVEVGSR